jgi:UDP-N-acetylglucosamine 2-epimerase (non-hydrolysing)
VADGLIEGNDQANGTARIGVVMGTRPEVIKLAPVIGAMRSSPVVEPVLIGTGQQADLFDSALADMDLRLDHVLDRDQGATTLTAMTAGLFTGLAGLLPTLSLSAVIVHGDTTSSVVGAMVAFYQGLQLIHVEAGLRSGDRHSPYPEEVNRRMTSLMADLHLAPTAQARDILLREGVDSRSIVVTGNTVLDAVDQVAGDAPVRSSDPRLAGLADDPRKIVILTTHRRESWGAPMARIAAAVAGVAHRHADDVVVVVPVHPNPVVRQALLPLAALPNVMLTMPLAYREFLGLLSRASVVLTDSGGIQEEAPSFGVPVLVLRDQTERQEGLATGQARLVGTSESVVSAALESVLAGGQERSRPTSNPYGDGSASLRCLQAMTRHLGLEAGGYGSAAG